MSDEEVCGVSGGRFEDADCDVRWRTHSPEGGGGDNDRFDRLVMAAERVGNGGGPEFGMSGETMEIEMGMKLVGRVRVLKIFTHRVESGVNCGVVIEVKGGSVLGLHC
ncbi:hypothetical protein HanPSC8_Chr10g0438581 [Helianthus annuus]|nr:hypothetical protein HanPSC8_Chr10g0438581 [Helianthus annuus]